MDGTGSNLGLADTTRRRVPAAARGGGWLDRLWLVVCLVVSSVWCATASPHLGPTFDEPNYIANGLECWRSGSYARLMRQGTMPLPVDVISWPLYAWERARGVPLRISSNEKGHTVVLEDLHGVLPVARLGTLPFWWLLLVYAWRIGGLAGPWGARLALLLTACEPNLLAHAALATTDIAVTACLLMLAWHFASGRMRGWRWRVLLPGILFGAALLAKASALVFGPLCLLAIELHGLLASRQVAENPADVPAARRLRGEFRASLRDGCQIFLLGLATAFVYVGTDFRPEPSFVEWAHGLPGGALRHCMIPVADHLRIFPNAGEGLVYQIKHNLRGHGVYILGETHHRALWWYFPAVLAIKLNVGLLLLGLVVACLCPRALWSWAIAAAAALLLFSLTCRVQIGIRLVLPLVALLAIGIAGAVAPALATLQSVRGRRLCLAAATLGCGWAVLSSALAWPHALAYTNELFRHDWPAGPALCDSNIDWGQGLVELDAWRRERGLEQINVWYFGTDPAVHHAPFKSVPLHHIGVTNLQELRAHLDGTHLAVSTTLLFGPAHSVRQRQARALLRGLEPVDRTTTLYIFDLGARCSVDRVAEYLPPDQR